MRLLTACRAISSTCSSKVSKIPAMAWGPYKPYVLVGYGYKVDYFDC